MTISEMITELSKLKEVHGDLTVANFHFEQWNDQCEFGGFQVEQQPWEAKPMLRPALCWQDDPSKIN